MRKFSLFILLFLIGAVAVFGHDSEQSCEEGNNKELVCSQEVQEAIERENKGLPPLPPKNKIKDIETTPSPLTTAAAPPPPPPPAEEEYYDGDYE